MIPEEEEPASSMTTGASIIASETEPANAVDAAAVKATASTSFFIIILQIRRTQKFNWVRTQDLPQIPF